MPENRDILIIDETIREGMQYRGVMFSLEQRLEILGFQEELGVDICQAGYPPAHETEQKIVQTLSQQARDHHFRTRVAAMGRFCMHDAKVLIRTGINHLHFHIHLDHDLSGAALETQLNELEDLAGTIKKQNPDFVISIAMLDIGRSQIGFLKKCTRLLDSKNIDILSLPDTSGMMAPNQVHDKIRELAPNLTHAKISIHCHNDMGMANANAVMGIVAGAKILEATALGIGERNGLSDLYVTARQLKNQGYRIHLNTDNTKIFQAYYEYVDQIVFEQTGVHLLTANTPVFGDAVRTHVAGTHSCGRYGLHSKEKITLNGLCGKHLVKKFLHHHQIECPGDLLGRLTRDIKTISFQQNRSLTPSQVKKLVSSLDG